VSRPSSGLPFLPWYPARFMSATRGWSVTARGIYRELLDCQWEMGSLPPTPAELQQLIGATAAEWKCWPSLVEPKFPLDTDNRRRNPTLEQHRAKSLGIRERNQVGASKTNAKRWGAKVVPFQSGGKPQ
jgi:uncharacterized protein YdaU (DUF1376 family)